MYTVQYVYLASRKYPTIVLYNVYVHCTYTPSITYIPYPLTFTICLH